MKIKMTFTVEIVKEIAYNQSDSIKTIVDEVANSTMKDVKILMNTFSPPIVSIVKAEVVNEEITTQEMRAATKLDSIPSVSVEKI